MIKPMFQKKWKNDAEKMTETLRNKW